MTDRDPLEVAEIRAQQIARMIEAALPKGWLYMLWLVSARDTDGYMTYLSNADRQDAIRAVEEWLERAKGGKATETDALCWCCGEREILFEVTGPQRSVTLCSKCCGTVREKE